MSLYKDSPDGNGISVIICCYNSSARLPETIGSLAIQEVEPSFSWELILVDNNSEDNTLQVMKELSKELSATVNVTITSEPRKGQYFARQTGIQLSIYKYVLFCDDDNWLAKDYLRKAYHILESDSSIGALGGSGIAVLEKENKHFPPIFLKNFAVGDQGQQSGDVRQDKGCLYGAGTLFRKKALYELGQYQYTQNCIGRTKATLGSGDDTELTYAIRMMGYKLWFDKGLTFKHYITKGRNNMAYLKRLYFGFGIAHVRMLSYAKYFDSKEIFSIDDANDIKDVRVFAQMKLRKYCGRQAVAILKSIPRLRFRYIYYSLCVTISYIEGYTAELKDQEKVGKCVSNFNWFAKHFLEKKD